MSKCPLSFFSFFKRKKDITFFSRLPYGEKVFPIQDSSTVNRKWKDLAKKQFAEYFKNSHPSKRLTGVHRCPGIKNIMDMGFIVSAPRDYYIQTTGDNKILKVWDNKDLAPSFKNDIGFFSPETFSEYMGDNLPVGAIDTLLKFHLPWNFSIPKDLIFIVMDVPYKDDNRFQACPGILDPLVSNELTFIYYWFVKEGIETIKRGTPLVQLIPISRSKPYTSWKMESAPDSFLQKIEMFKFARFGTKITNYDKLKTVSENLFYS
jgi:hypothetical protein